MPAHMAQVSIRDLRNHGGEVIDRVAAGERLTVTRSGRAVAELRPIGSRRIQSKVLLERWARIPKLDLVRLRTDIDSAVDSAL